MSASGSGGNPSAAELSGRHRQPMADLRRRIHARLAERIDPVRHRHKPLSLLRQEGKRIVDQFLDAECPLMTRAEREALADEILVGAATIGLLEELYRDGSVQEILLLSSGPVIARKGDAWIPTNIRLRDRSQFQALLSRFSEVGEPLIPDAQMSGGLDVRLPNGFRAIAVLPPDVLDIPPLALLVRHRVGEAAAGSSVKGQPASGVSPSGPKSGVGLGVDPVVTPGPKSGVGLGTAGSPEPRSGIWKEPSLTPGPKSGVGLGAGPKSGIGPGLESPSSGPRSGNVTSTTVPGAASPSPSPPSGVMADPLAKIRQRVTERIIASLASAGVYDISLLPLADLRKVVLAYVAEVNAQDRLGLDESMEERLALEILAGMNR
jgi:pilus assembly protein CpaF